MRGVGANVLWLEEFAHIKKDIIDIIVAPLAAVEGTRIWAISSPLDENNHASEIADIVDPRTGKKHFFVLRSAWCDACCRSLTATNCEHTKKRLPTHFSSKSARFAKSLMGENFRSKQELDGVAMGDGEYFMSPWMPAFVSKAPQHMSNIDMVWVFVDPSPGNSLSDFAIVSVARVVHPFQMVIVGLDRLEGDGSGQNLLGGSNLIVDHISNLLKTNTMHDAKVVLIIESVHHVDVSGSYCTEVLKYFQSIGQESRLFIERKMPHPEAYGVGKTERDTWAMAVVTHNYLRQDWINFTYDSSMVGSHPGECRKLLLAQLATFHIEKKPKLDGTMKSLIRSKGKDDLAICLQSVLFHEDRIRTYSTAFKDWSEGEQRYTAQGYKKTLDKRQKIM